MNKYFLTPKPTGQVGPVTLREHLIRLATMEDVIIFDPFIGSGTTVIATRNTGRHFVGADIGPDYIAIAQRQPRQ